MRRLIALAALGLAAGCGEEAAAPSMSADEVAAAADGLIQPRPGLYRNTVEFTGFEVPGLPSGEAERMRDALASEVARASEFCLTEAQASEGIEEAVRRMGEGSAGMRCEFERFETDGGRFDARLGCEAHGRDLAMTMRGQVFAERQATTLMIEQDFGPAAMTIGLDVTAERVGECPAAPSAPAAD